MIAVSVNVVSDLPLLFMPLQMLWINFVTNGVQDIALAFEPGKGNELDRPPRSRDEGLLSNVLWIRTGLCGLWMATAILVVFHVMITQGASVTLTRTMSLTLLVLFNFFMSISARSETIPIWRLNPLDNRFLLIAAIGALLLHAAAMYIPGGSGLLGMVPLDGGQWLVCWLIAITVLVFCEGDKAVRSWLRSRGHSPRSGLQAVGHRAHRSVAAVLGHESSPAE